MQTNLENAKDKEHKLLVMIENYAKDTEKLH